MRRIYLIALLFIISCTTEKIKHPALSVGDVFYLQNNPDDDRIMNHYRVMELRDNGIIASRLNSPHRVEYLDWEEFKDVEFLKPQPTEPEEIAPDSLLLDSSYHK